MFARLLPFGAALFIALLIFLARKASRKKSEARFVAAGLGDAPQGTPLLLHGQKRPMRVVDGVSLSVGLAKTRTRNPVTVIGSYRRFQGNDTIRKVTITMASHLWLVYPQPYPYPFSLSAGPGEQPQFEGNFEEMSDLLNTERVARSIQELLELLAPLNGELWVDHTMVDLILPADVEVTPLLLGKSLDLWRAVRDGSEYPYRAEPV